MYPIIWSIIIEFGRTFLCSAKDFKVGIKETVSVLYHDHFSDNKLFTLYRWSYQAKIVDSERLNGQSRSKN